RIFAEPRSVAFLIGIRALQGGYCTSAPASVLRPKPEPGRNELDVDAVVAGDTRETGRVALADGAELPLRTVAVQLAEDHGGLGRGVLGQVVTSEFVAVRAVDDADVSVADLAERLAAGIGIVDRDREEDALDVRRGGGEVD